jgi:hypothetical protein
MPFSNPADPKPCSVYLQTRHVYITVFIKCVIMCIVRFRGSVISLAVLCVSLHIITAAILPDRPARFASSCRSLPDTAAHQPNVGQLALVYSYPVFNNHVTVYFVLRE